MDYLNMMIIKREFAMEQLSLKQKIKALTFDFDFKFPPIEFVDIRTTIDMFNCVMQSLTYVYNCYVDQINSLNSIYIIPTFDFFNLEHATYCPIVLDTYCFPVSVQLLGLLYIIKYDTIRLYKKLIAILAIIPELKSLEQIENEIEYQYRNINQ